MNFEWIDNLFQVVVLGCAALLAAVLALRHKSRRCLILSLAYACFSMGTLYYVLYLVILGHTPKVFYVAEVSWLASWLFYLSLQILRTESMKIQFSWSVVGGSLLIFTSILAFHIFGPSYLMSFLFALTVGILTFLSLSRLQSQEKGRQVDVLMLVCAVLQVLLYVVSGFTRDYTHFNLYFGVDLALTLSFAALLPVNLWEENQD